MNNSGKDDHRKPLDQSLVTRFEELVLRFPHRVAVWSRSKTLSYEQLNWASNRLALSLLSRDVSKDEPVALFFRQGIDAIVSTLGILKTGRFYVALDPDHSPDRILQTITTSQASLVVTSKDYISRLQDLAPASVPYVVLDDAEETSRFENPGVAINPDDLAYIYFTSGSTGIPKGVMDTHRNVLQNVMRYTNSLEVRPDDRFSLLQSCSFSGTVSSLFSSLLNGASVVPIDMQSETPSSLARLVNESAISIFHSVPSIFRSMCAGANSGFPGVRIIRLEGDQATGADAELYRVHFPENCVLVNGLGTTETGLVSQYFVGKQTETDDGILPIGYPLPDIELIILGENGDHSPPNAIGEIAVRSRFLSPGYWRDEAATRSAFRTDDRDPAIRTYHTGDLGRKSEDGKIVLLGRNDSHLKVRGQWIDVAEIEKRLSELQDVRSVIVTTRMIHDKQRLVAYFVPGRRPIPTASRLRNHLSESLPDAMIPAFFVSLPEIPLSQNGKIDRTALPDPSSDRPDLDAPYQSPRSELEKQLVNIWEDVLERHPIGIDDDFLDLGGDSLLVLTLADRIQEKTGLDLSRSLLARSATVEELATNIGLEADEYFSSLIQLFQDSPVPKLFFLHGDYFTGGLYCRRVSRGLANPESVFFAKPVKTIDGRMPASYEEMARIHVSELKSIQPEGPYCLGGHCNGGLAAFEMARLLKAQGDEVQLLVLVAATASNIQFTSLRRTVGKWANVLRLSNTVEENVYLGLRRGFLEMKEVPVHRVVRLSLSMIKRSVWWLRRKIVARDRKQSIPETSGPTIGSDTDSVTYIARLMKRYHRIDELYIPKYLDGTVTLLWPEADRETAREAAASWQQVCSNVVLRQVSGTHQSCTTVYAEEFGSLLMASLYNTPTS